MELLRNEKTYNSNKKEQWKFLVIFPKRSTETSVCFITSKILALLSLFSLFTCKFQIGFLLTPVRRIFSTTQVIRLGSSHFCFRNFRSTCSSPNLRCVSSILSVSSIVKILWSLMCCYSLFLALIFGLLCVGLWCLCYLLGLWYEIKTSYINTKPLKLRSFGFIFWVYFMRSKLLFFSPLHYSFIFRLGLCVEETWVAILT